MKHAVLNREFGEVRTVIVLGVGRGGTSLVAGCLRALGVCMGTNAHPIKHEWSPMSYDAEGKLELAPTIRVVEEMNRTHGKWGWKSPRDIFQVEQLLPFLRDPGFVFVTRDLAEASLSGVSYQDVPFDIALDETAHVYYAITRRLRYWPWPILTLPFAEALREPGTLVELLCSFMALAPGAEAREQAVAFVQPGANSYRQFNARPGDPLLVTSAEDLRNDTEGLAVALSARYGQEYWHRFEEAVQEIRAMAAELSQQSLIAEEAIMAKLLALMPPAVVPPAPSEESPALIKVSGAGIEPILERLSGAAQEARRRLQNRAPHSGYDDLARLFRVLRVTIRIRHALKGVLLECELEGSKNEIPMIEIVPFAAPYLEGVGTLIVGIQRDEFQIPITLDDQPDLRDIPAFYQQGAGNFWVAVSKNEVVGTVALLDLGNHQAALRKMFVHASYRGPGHGVSARLLDTLLEWSRTRGVKHIYLGTTEKFLAAHRFYERNAFRRVVPDELPANFPKMAVDSRFYRRTL